MRNKLIYGAIAIVAAASMTACSDDDVTINNTPIIESVQTGDVDVTATTATVHGYVSDLTSQDAARYTVGAVYSTSQDPTASGTRQPGSLVDGSAIEVSLTGLQDGVTYYYAVYVTLQDKVTYYGEVKSFVTTDALVATADAASVTSVSANLGGTLNGVSDMLESGTLEHGIKIAASADGVQSGIVLTPEGESNAYSVAIQNLVPRTTYYYAAYTVLNGAENYGEVKSFTTSVSAADAEQEVSDFVDMGTTKEWCMYNVGADKVGARGGLYGHGDVTGLARSVSNADYTAESTSRTALDIAQAAGMGFIPTVDDFNELLAATTRQAATVDGVKGVQFTSTVNGNTLFFPFDGIRDGEEISDADLLGAYMTGVVNSVNKDYTSALKLTADGAEYEQALRSAGLSVRPVRMPFVREVAVDVTKVLFNNKDGNGVDGRIEIYNEYGSTGGDNSPLNLGMLKFEKSMAVYFTVEGINDNLKEGAAGTYNAGLSFAANGWYPSLWSAGRTKYDCVVKGDGTYMVWFEPEAASEGAVVFCVELYGLWQDLVDQEKVKVTDLRIVLDSKDLPKFDYPVDNSLLVFNNKDGNGVDGRIEIFNEYGDTKGLGADYSGLHFCKGTMSMNFTITGIDGNLKSGATSDYLADISYAAASWYPSYWGGECGSTHVTGDGTYDVACYIEAESDGAVVFCIELYGLWQDLEDPSKVQVKINNLSVPY